MSNFRAAEWILSFVPSMKLEGPAQSSPQAWFPQRLCPEDIKSGRQTGQATDPSLQEAYPQNLSCSQEDHFYVKKAVRKNFYSKHFSLLFH